MTDGRGRATRRPVERVSPARSRRSRALAILLIASVVAAGCGARPDRGLKGFVPRDVTRTGTVLLPEVHADGSGAPFALKAPAGGLLIVYFGYVSCPDVCPTTLADVRTALRGLSGEMARCQVAFVTVDPARDSAAVLAPYLGSFVAGGHALRPASQEQLAQAERAFGATSNVTRDLTGKVEVSHSTTTYVVDDTGRIRVEWGFGTSAADMTHDLGILLAAPTGDAR